MLLEMNEEDVDPEGKIYRKKDTRMNTYEFEFRPLASGDALHEARVRHL